MIDNYIRFWTNKIGVRNTILIDMAKWFVLGVVLGLML